MNIRLITTAAALLAVAPTSGAQSADERAVAQLANRLLEVAASYSSRGWYVHDFEPVVIDDGGRHHFDVYLEAGDQVIFRGMGDDDARDLDLGVYGPGGRLVARDTDGDATPVARFTARRSGHYTVVMTLPSCWADYSYAALLFAER